MMMTPRPEEGPTMTILLIIIPGSTSPHTCALATHRDLGYEDTRSLRPGAKRHAPTLTAGSMGEGHHGPSRAPGGTLLLIAEEPVSHT
jgi:hypothetical protein